jgi:hypothetical protein
LSKVGRCICCQATTARLFRCPLTEHRTNDQTQRSTNRNCTLSIRQPYKQKSQGWCKLFRPHHRPRRGFSFSIFLLLASPQAVHSILLVTWLVGGLAWVAIDPSAPYLRSSQSEFQPVHGVPTSGGFGPGSSPPAKRLELRLPSPFLPVLIARCQGE